MQPPGEEVESTPVVSEFRTILKGELQAVIQELRELKGDIKALDVQLNNLEGKSSQFESTLEQVKLDASVAAQKVVDLENRIGTLDSANKALDEEVGDLNTMVEDLWSQV